MKYYGRTIKYPKCGSDKIIPVVPSDYVKECKSCGHQFSGGGHN